MAGKEHFALWLMWANNRPRGNEMPSKSDAQRAWAFGVKGEKWARAHHFDNKGKLPKRVTKKKTRKVDAHHAYHGGD